MKIWAFWKYDRFPYLLGDEAGEMKGMSVCPKSYGGYWFRAKFFLPDELGQNLKSDLKDLQYEKDAVMKKIHDEFEQKRVELLKKYGQNG